MTEGDQIDDLIVRASFGGGIRQVMDVQVLNGWDKEDSEVPAENACVRTFRDGGRTFLMMMTDHVPGGSFNGDRGVNVAARLTRNQTLALVRALLETLREE